MPELTQAEKNRRGVMILVGTFGSLFAVWLVLALIYGPGESRSNTLSDREQIEAGAAKIDTFCRNNPNAC